ncbi:MAG: hypothetical protein ABEH56_05280 [Salinirussus sp.]
MSRPVVLGLAFVLTLGAVLGAAVVSAQLGTGETIDDPPTIENEQYTDENLLKARTPGTADVNMEADAEPQTIVVDPGLDPGEEPGPRLPFIFGDFGPETTERQIEPLLNALVENGHEVRIYTPGGGEGGRPAPPDIGPGAGSESESLTPLGRQLADADAFVTFRTDYSEEQLSAIETFVEADGRVLAATDPADAFDEPGTAGLASTLNVTTEPGYVYNMETNDMNFQRIFATPAGGSSLTDGVDRVVFPTATPVDAMGSTDASMVPIDGSQLSTSRASTDAPVMVRTGGVVLVGDTNFLWPSNARRADNDVLIGNLADFLVTNDRNATAQPPSPPEPSTPAPGPGGPSPPGEPPAPPSPGDGDGGGEPSSPTPTPSARTE